VQSRRLEFFVLHLTCTPSIREIEEGKKREEMEGGSRGAYLRAPLPFFYAAFRSASRKDKSGGKGGGEKGNGEVVEANRNRGSCVPFSRTCQGKGREKEEESRTDSAPGRARGHQHTPLLCRTSRKRQVGIGKKKRR